MAESGKKPELRHLSPCGIAAIYKRGAYHGNFYLTVIEIPYRFEHCDHVFRGGFGLDIMDGVENKPAVFAEYPAAFKSLVIYFPGRSEWQRLLRVYSASPENYAASVFFLEQGPVHAGRRPLNRVEYVKAGVDKFGYKRFDGSATVLECFPVCIAVYPIIDL